MQNNMKPYYNNILKNNYFMYYILFILKFTNKAIY